MELKSWFDAANVINQNLLIVPYGIEIGRRPAKVTLPTTF